MLQSMGVDIGESALSRRKTCALLSTGLRTMFVLSTVDKKPRRAGSKRTKTGKKRGTGTSSAKAAPKSASEKGGPHPSLLSAPPRGHHRPLHRRGRRCCHSGQGCCWRQCQRSVSFCHRCDRPDSSLDVSTVLLVQESSAAPAARARSARPPRRSRPRTARPAQMPRSCLQSCSFTSLAHSDCVRLQVKDRGVFVEDILREASALQRDKPGEAGDEGEHQ